MTETRPTYWVPQDTTALDSCVRDEALPKCMAVVTPGEPIREEHRQAACRVLEESRLEIARRLRTSTFARESESGRRAVRLWDLLEFSVSSGGLDLRIEHLGDDPDTSHCLINLSLSKPIERYNWPSAFDSLLVSACRETGLNPKVLPGPIGCYMRQVMRRTFRDYVDWNGLRRAVLEYLRPDPLVYSLTRRVFEGGFVRLDSFNWVADHARELSLVAIEHPRLLPLLQITSHMKGGSPVENFEHAIHRAGIRRSARRKLELWGFDALLDAAEFGSPDHRATTIALYANLLDRLHIDEEPPTLFTQVVVAHAGLNAPLWFVKALWDEIQSLQDNYPDDPYLPLDFEDPVKWLASRPPEPDENQQRAGWMWIIAQSRRYRLASDESALAPWKVPCGEAVCGAYRVVPLRNLRDLMEEAEAMRNCLATMRDDCAAGRIAVFSIRDPSGKRLASFRLVWDATVSRWRLLGILGKANSEVSSELTALAVTFVSKIHAAPSC